MIGRRRVLTSAGASLALASPLAAAGTGLAPAPLLRRGVNIHHMLNWPQHRGELPITYVWPPFGDKAYSTGAATLSALRRAGFTFIRLTLDPAIFMASDSAGRQALVAIVIARVRQLLIAGFEVVLDLHPVAENPTYAPERLTMPASPAFPAYLETVKLLASALRALPPDQVALELMNEPNPGGRDSVGGWQRMLESLHAAARGAAPNLTLVLSGANWSAMQGLTRIDLAPFRRSNVLYTFHYYEPHLFTHQGVAKASPERYFGGLLWPPQESQFGEMAALVRQRVFEDPTLGAAERVERAAEAKKYLSRYMGVADAPGQIVRDFEVVARWASDNAIAPRRILLGEFGAYRSSSETAAVRSARINWIQAVRKVAEAKGFGWAYWVLREASAGQGGFGLLPSGADLGFERDAIRALGLSVG
jgi:hypothetical protein